METIRSLLKTDIRLEYIIKLFPESPRIVETSSPSSMRVRSGTTVSLDCRSKGHPHPRVSWNKMQGGRWEKSINLKIYLCRLERSFTRIKTLIRSCCDLYAVFRPKIVVINTLFFHIDPSLYWDGVIPNVVRYYLLVIGKLSLVWGK